MQHIRILVPSERTAEIIAVLRSCDGLAHLSLFEGAALEPVGDVIEADFTRESSNEILESLRELNVVDEGGIAYTTVDSMLSLRADLAEKRVPGDPDDAVVWEQLLGRNREDATLTLTFLSFLTIATLLVAVGVVTNSPVTIVGAMVLGPEFGPLAALAVGLVLRRHRLALRALIALVVSFPLAMLITAVAALAAEVTGLFDVSSLGSLDQVDFIYQVGPESFLVSLLAGAAGMLAMLSSKSSALVGVFISVTTVPAAGFAVVAATAGSWRIAGLSSLQLLVNLVGIVVAAALVLLLRLRFSTSTRFDALR